MVTERCELRAADERFANQYMRGLGGQPEIRYGCGNVVQRADDAQVAQPRIRTMCVLVRLCTAVLERMHDTVRGHQLLRPCQQQGNSQRNGRKMASDKHAVQFIDLS